MADDCNFIDPIDPTSGVGEAVEPGAAPLNTLNRNFSALQDGICSLFHIFPVGTILLYASTTAPRGWLVCDGSYVSQTTYSTLYSVASTTFGPSVSGFFKLPDLRSRLFVGAGQTPGDGLTARILGNTGGVETVTLSSANQNAQHNHAIGEFLHSHVATMSAHTHSLSDYHTHTVNDPGHAHPVYYGSTLRNSISCEATALVTGSTTVAAISSVKNNLHNVVNNVFVGDGMIYTINHSLSSVWDVNTRNNAIALVQNQLPITTDAQGHQVTGPFWGIGTAGDQNRTGTMILSGQIWQWQTQVINNGSTGVNSVSASICLARTVFNDINSSDQNLTSTSVYQHLHSLTANDYWISSLSSNSVMRLSSGSANDWIVPVQSNTTATPLQVTIKNSSAGIDTGTPGVTSTSVVHGFATAETPLGIWSSDKRINTIVAATSSLSATWGVGMQYAITHSPTWNVDQIAAGLSALNILKPTLSGSNYIVNSTYWAPATGVDQNRAGVVSVSGLNYSWRTQVQGFDNISLDRGCVQDKWINTSWQSLARQRAINGAVAYINNDIDAVTSWGNDQKTAAHTVANSLTGVTGTGQTSNYVEGSSTVAGYTFNWSVEIQYEQDYQIGEVGAQWPGQPNSNPAWIAEVQLSSPGTGLVTIDFTLVSNLASTIDYIPTSITLNPAIAPVTVTTAFANLSAGYVGGNQLHDNIQPYLSLTPIIKI